MSEFAIKKATRQGVKPLIGLYSESGCGKTYSALLLARGFVGPSGKIGMVDSESGRGSLYADVLPGGYEVLEITEPFSPERYIEAIQAVERSGAQIGIIDSASHEWEGLGGVLDMAGESERKNGRSLNNWRGPKMEHARFMLRMLQSSIPWIICLRAKYKTRQTKGTEEMAKADMIKRSDVGKSVVVKDDHTTPIQAEDFIYEMTCHAEVLPDHSINLTKCSHPSLRSCFPAKGPITSQHGEAIAKWCAAPGVTQSAKPSANPLKAELWKLTTAIHKNDPKALLTWIVDELGLQTVTSLESLTDDELEAVLAKARQKLGERRAA